MTEKNDHKNASRTRGLKPPWKPGQSGNPKGRPAVKPITDELRKVLAGTTLAGKSIPGGLTVAEAIVVGMVKAAMSGNPRMVKELLDRVEGKVADVVQHQAEDDQLTEILARVMGGSGGKQPGDASGPERRRRVSRRRDR